jgi:hypothetical protein
MRLLWDGNGLCLEPPGKMTYFDRGVSFRRSALMMRIFIAALMVVFAAGAAEAKVSKEVVTGVQKAITESGCTVEADDIKVKGDEADDVQCKDGQYDVLLDKAFKIAKKSKED